MTTSSGVSPHFGCGTPIAAASLTSGWRTNTRSMSAAKMFQPTRVDHVLDAARQEEEAVLVEVPDVPGAHEGAAVRMGSIPTSR